MQINLSIVVSLFVIFSYSALLIIVIRRDDHTRLLRSFAYYLLIMILWGFGSFMIFVSPPILTTTFWNRFMAIGQLAMPLMFYRFVQYFLGRQLGRLYSFGILGYLSILLSDAYGLLIASSSVVGGRVYYELGAWQVFLLAAVHWSTLLGISTLDLYRAYRNSNDAVFRNRIRYLLLAVVSIFLGSLTNATQLRYYPIDILFNLLSAVIISYAILRHQLLDIRILIRKGMVYSIPTAFIGAIYFFTISLVQDIFAATSGFQIFFVTFAVALITAIAIQPLRDVAQSWVDRIFFREKYDVSMMMQRISKIISAGILDFDQLAMQILEDISRTMHIQNAALLLLDHNQEHFILVSKIGLEETNGIVLDRSHPMINVLAHNGRIIRRQDLDILPEFKGLWDQEKTALKSIHAELFVPLQVKDRLIGIFTFGPKMSGETYSQDECLTLTTLSNQTAVAIENAHLFGDVSSALNREKQINSISRIINGTLTLDALHKDVVQLACEIIGADAGLIALVEDQNGGINFPYLYNLPEGSFNHPTSNGRGIIGTIINNRKPYLVNELRPSKETIPELAMVVINSLLGVPLIAGEDLIGALVLCSFSPKVKFDSRDVDLVEAIGRNSGMAIQNAQFLKQTEEALDREQQLHRITRTISGELDMRSLFDKVGDLIAGLVDADLVSVVVFAQKDNSSDLVFQYSRPECSVEGIDGLEKGLMLDIYRQGQPMLLEKYSRQTDPHPAWVSAGVSGFLGVPVYAGEKKIGTLGLFKISARAAFKKNDLLIAEIIGRQIGIAIQNALLYEELEDAYLETITALVNAMDLRDTYTNAHSLRLANWAVETARACGCMDDEVESVRWGALLHDIGKIGIPDSILQKPGPLTEDEWQVMEKHPEFGAEIITPIKRLKQVAPIILAHQERFDGTGYPNQLKGDQIPMGARILAVVDTFGAIIDDRVYRKGRDENAAIEEITRQAGTQFDPAVVEAFLAVRSRLMEEHE